MRAFSNSFTIRATTPSANFLLTDKLKVVAGVFDTSDLVLTDIKIDSVSIWPGNACPSDNAFHTIELIGSGSMSYFGVDDPDAPSQWYAGSLQWFSADGVRTTFNQNKTDHQIPDGEIISDLITPGTGTMDNEDEWGLSGTVIAAGKMLFDANSDQSRLDDAIYEAKIPANKLFEVNLEVLDYIKGVYSFLQVKDGDSTQNYIAHSSGGNYSTIIQTLNPNFIFRLSTNGGSLSMDNLVIKELTSATIFNNIVESDYDQEGTYSLDYPLSASINSTRKDYNDPSYQDGLAKYDLVELGFYRDWNYGSGMAGTVDEIHAKGLLNKNGGVLISNYTMLMTHLIDPSDNHAKRDIYEKLEAENWWLRYANRPDDYVSTSDPATTHGRVNLGPEMQPNSEWQTWYAQRQKDVLFSLAAFDIVYVDNCFASTRVAADWNMNNIDDPGEAIKDDTNDAALAFRWGTNEYFKQLNLILPNLPLLANYDHGADYDEYRNKTAGGLMEHADTKISWMTWEVFMNTWYYQQMQNTLPPHYVIWDGMTDWLTTNYKQMRFGLCSCLMNNGYYCASPSDGGFSATPWYDELDVRMGMPLDNPPTPDGDNINVRKYTKGFALVNPTKSSKTYNFAAEDQNRYTRFSGSQAPSINNGQPAGTSITIPAEDGIVLVKI